jgi:hypothetical protein
MVLEHFEERAEFGAFAQRVFNVNWFAVWGGDDSSALDIVVGSDKQTPQSVPLAMFWNKMDPEPIAASLSRNTDPANRARLAHWLQVAGPIGTRLYLPVLQPGMTLAVKLVGKHPTHVFAIGESLQ